MPYLSCKKIENDVYNFPTWQYCKYKDIFDSRIIINSTAKFYISISYQKDLLSIDTRIFTPSKGQIVPLSLKIYLYFSNCSYQSSGNPICLNDISFSYSSTIAFNSIKTLLIHSFLFGYNNFNTSICENNFLFGDISNSLGILGNAGNDQ